MAEPVYFVVRRYHGAEGAALFYDVLPEGLTRKRWAEEQPELVYGLRLDRLPDGHEWRQAGGLRALMALYERHKAAGTLPPANFADPPRDKGKTTLALGDRRQRMARPWGEQQPAEPYPEPGTLRQRRDAPAFVDPATAALEEM